MRLNISMFHVCGTEVNRPATGVQVIVCFRSDDTVSGNSFSPFYYHPWNEHRAYIVFYSIIWNTVNLEVLRPRGNSSTYTTWLLAALVSETNCIYPGILHIKMYDTCAMAAGWFFFTRTKRECQWGYSTPGLICKQLTSSCDCERQGRSSLVVCGVTGDPAIYDWRKGWDVVLVNTYRVYGNH